MSVPAQIAALLDGQLDVGFVRPPVDDAALNSEIVLSASRSLWHYHQRTTSLRPSPDPLQTAIAWRREDTSATLAEFISVARRSLHHRRE